MNMMFGRGEIDSDSPKCFLATLNQLATLGSEIDLLIVRDDNVVNLCEMKFAGDVYSIDKDEEAKLRNRIEMLKNTLTPKQTIHPTMVTTYGVAYGKHSGIVQKLVTMDDLFG